MIDLVLEAPLAESDVAAIGFEVVDHVREVFLL